MRFCKVVLILILLTGCSYKTVFTTPEGEVWTIDHERQSNVRIELANRIIMSTDNKLAPSWFSRVTETWAAKEARVETTD